MESGKQKADREPFLMSNGWTHAGISAELYDATSGLSYQAALVAPDETAKFLRLQIIGSSGL